MQAQRRPELLRISNARPRNDALQVRRLPSQVPLTAPRGEEPTMSGQSIASSLASFPPTVATDRAAARPAAARTRLILEGPVLSTLLRLSAPNVLNLLAIAGMITFDGLFLGRLGPDALAGVSLAFPFVMLIQHTAASGMGGGVSSAIARALGAGKRDVADAL